jgi:putative SOS response-associated peptidase YedK
VCGRYAAARDTASLVEEFEVDEVAEAAPDANFNVAPTNEVAFIVEREGEQGRRRSLRRGRWGLVPSWAEDPKVGSRMINARREGVASRPAFRTAFAQRRCVLPADGYYEWYRPQPGSGSAKQPFFIHRLDGHSLAMAGLYSFWRGEQEAAWLVTVAVLTTAAAGPLAAIHDRMPVLLSPADYQGWLDPDGPVGEDFRPTLDLGLLGARPVSAAVNSVRNNGAHLLDPLPAA